jgi:hypothetical protein
MKIAIKLCVFFVLLVFFKQRHIGLNDSIALSREKILNSKPMQHGDGHVLSQKSLENIQKFKDDWKKQALDVYINDRMLLLLRASLGLFK